MYLPFLTDPLQDFAFTLESCSGLTSGSFNIRAATVLRKYKIYFTTNEYATSLQMCTNVMQ